MGKSCSKPAAPALEPSAEPEAPLEPEPEPAPAPEPASYGATAAEDVVAKAAPARRPTTSRSPRRAASTIACGATTAGAA